MSALRFSTGQIVATPGSLACLTQADITRALARHVSGDWGDVCEEDRLANDDALTGDGRLLSVYRSQDDVKFWIITEADRSATTILLPEEY
jgi:hypothetical protein